MTPHVHHWDIMMIIEETTKSLFTSDLFIQPGNNKPVSSDDMSEAMLALYRAIGIFSSENPVRQSTRRLVKLDPSTVFLMHGSCFDRSMFRKYADAILKEEFAYNGKLLRQDVEVIS